jgi:hypothetical protein
MKVPVVQVPSLHNTNHCRLPVVGTRARSRLGPNLSVVQLLEMLFLLHNNYLFPQKPFETNLKIHKPSAADLNFKKFLTTLKIFVVLTWS